MVTLSIKNLTAGEILAIKRDEMRGVIPSAWQPQRHSLHARVPCCQGRELEAE